MPDIIGSTTFSVAATATAASKALPPASRISRPAWVASGCAELIIPRVPTAGREAVLRLVGVAWAARARQTASTKPPSKSANGQPPVMLISLPPVSLITISGALRGSHGAGAVRPLSPYRLQRLGSNLQRAVDVRVGVGQGQVELAARRAVNAAADQLVAEPDGLTPV